MSHTLCFATRLPVFDPKILRLYVLISTFYFLSDNSLKKKHLQQIKEIKQKWIFDIWYLKLWYFLLCNYKSFTSGTDTGLLRSYVLSHLATRDTRAAFEHVHLKMCIYDTKLWEIESVSIRKNFKYDFHLSHKDGR